MLLQDENGECENAYDWIILNHRDRENTEKNREGVFHLDKRLREIEKHNNRIRQDARNER